MGIINRMRKQNAIYWPPSTPDDFGRPASGALVELVLDGTSNYRVRWEDTIATFVDPQGTTQVSNAVVYVPQLPDASEVTVGGYLWLGDRADLTDDAVPLNNPGAYEVRRFDSLPDFKNKEKLRTAYL